MWCHAVCGQVPTLWRKLWIKLHSVTSQKAVFTQSCCHLFMQVIRVFQNNMKKWLLERSNAKQLLSPSSPQNKSALTVQHAFWVPVWNLVVFRFQTHSTVPGWRQLEDSRAAQPSGSRCAPPCTCGAACMPLPIDSQCHSSPCSVPSWGSVLLHPKPGSGQ